MFPVSKMCWKTSLKILPKLKHLVLTPFLKVVFLFFTGMLYYLYLY